MSSQRYPPEFKESEDITPQLPTRPITAICGPPYGNEVIESTPTQEPSHPPPPTNDSSR